MKPLSWTAYEWRATHEDLHLEIGRRSVDVRAKDDDEEFDWSVYEVTGNKNRLGDLIYEEALLVKRGRASSFLEANAAIEAVIEVWRTAKGRA